jgi:serine/threonine protein kinase
MRELRVEDPGQLGPFRLLGRLGAGGMGQVYLGCDDSGRWVAVKVIHDAHLGIAEFRQRFAREVQIAGQVRAPWTVALVAADPDAPRPWLATEYVAGPSLQQAVDSAGPLSEESVGIIASRLADALIALHSTGLIHRDLKPSNVMLSEDGPRLLDFGIARAMDATRITATGLTVGTPAFMSPEQTHGGDGGPASDVFSLASVLTYAATGTGPFTQASNPVAMLMKVSRGEPDLTALPAQLRAELQPCLAKDPAERPTARQLAHTMAHWTEPPGRSWPPPVVTRLLTPLPAVQLLTTPSPSPSVPSPAGGQRAPVAPTRRPFRDIPAGLTPTSTALRHLSVLLRRGHRPTGATAGLLALPLVALSILAAVLWAPWSNHDSPPPNDSTAPTTPVPARAAQFSSPVTINVGDRSTALAVSPDGNRVFTDVSAGIVVVDVPARRVVQTFHPAGNVQDLFTSPDGRSLYVVEWQLVEIMDAGTGRVNATIPLPQNVSFGHSTLSRDGTRLLLVSPGNNSPTLTVVDTITRTVRSDWPLPEFATGDIVVNGANSWAYITGVAVPLYQVNLENGQGTRLEPINGTCETAISADGRQLFVQSTSGLIVTLDADTAQTLHKVAASAPVGTLISTPDGQLIATPYLTQRILLLDPNTGAVLGTGQVDQTIEHAAVSPNGNQVFVTSDNNVRALILTRR